MDRVSIHKELYKNRRMTFPVSFPDWVPWSISESTEKYEWETGLGGLTGNFHFFTCNTDKKYIEGYR